MRKIIAVDFDGTLCENKWPDIGDPNLELIKYLKKEKKNGARLILWTCRMGERLDKAVAWCKEHKLTFNAVNENVKESIEAFGGDSRKIFAHEYIDDKFNPHFELPFTNTCPYYDSANGRCNGTEWASTAVSCGGNISKCPEY